MVNLKLAVYLGWMGWASQGLNDLSHFTIELALNLSTGKELGGNDISNSHIAPTIPY